MSRRRLPRSLLAFGTSRGFDNGPIEACVVRASGAGPRTLSITIALDIEAISEQADLEADDAPAGADRAWWAV